MDQVLAAYRTGDTAAPVQTNAAMEARFGIGMDELVARLSDPERGLTAHARRFSHLDALAAVANALPHGAGIEDVEHLTSMVLAHSAFLALPAAAADLAGPAANAPLAGSHQMSGRQLYTTRDVVTEVERTILAAAASAADSQDRARVLTATVDLAVPIVEAAQGFPLSEEQRDVLRRVVTSGRAVEAVEGPPSTGKTTLMRAARVAWEAAGYRVAGAATAAVAAQNLAAESGIPSRTVAQWLWRIDNGDGLAGIDVLVLDEANLTSDRDRAALYRAAAATGTKIVEVGDPKQLRGVGVSSMFGYLHQLLGGPRLTENRRQRQADERQALQAFRKGGHAEALHTWAKLGGVVATETLDEAVAAMVAAWLRLRTGAPDPHTLTAGLLMLAATNEQVGRINDATQAVRHTRGELGPGASLRLPGGRGTRFHVGDLVLIRRNDRHQQALTGDTVLNGYRGEVTGITPQGVEVAWRDPAAEPDAPLSTAVLSPSYIAQGGLELGYALTAHKAEGLTVGGQWQRPDGTTNQGSVLVYGPGLDNPGLYVSLSRDKGQAVVFGARAELEGDRENLVYGPPRTQTELTDRVIAALAERAAATADNANDRPVLVDLGQAPANPTGTTPTGPARQPQPDRDPPARPQRQRQPEPQREPKPPAERERQRERTPVGLSEQQRLRWRELDLRERAARLRGDQDAARALQAEKHALAAHLEPQRQDREPARDAGARELQRLAWRAQWEARPHARLSAGQLSQAIADAERHQARETAAAEQARRKLAQREPAVAAGQGRRVQEVDAAVQHHRERAELHARVEQILGRWLEVTTAVGDAAADAYASTAEAERTRWWQSGRREQLQAQAAEHRAAEQRGHAEAAELARQTADLQAILGGPQVWHLAREQAERAEATYPDARDRAQHADEAELTRLRQHITTHETTAADAGIRREELVAEQQLRDAMPQSQRIVETGFRMQASQQNQLRQLEQATGQPQPEPTQPEPSVLEAELDYDQRSLHQEIDIDRGGPSLGL